MEKHKEVEINGRKFRIRKFPARTGSFILIKMTGILAPLIKSAVGLSKNGNVAELENEKLGLGIIEEMVKISEADFNYLQEKCLGVCSEVLAGGLAPVLNENGTFGVIDFEEDTMSVLALTAHALMFNIAPVFQDAGLGSLLVSK